MRSKRSSFFKFFLFLGIAFSALLYAKESIKMTPKNNPTTERTLIILKPDCMQKNIAGTVLQRFLDAGTRLVACKMVQLNEAILNDHYAHLKNLECFPNIVAFMRSCPVLVTILEGEDAIRKVRAALGPTNSVNAPKGTIRGDFGKDITQNIAHASDSPQNAELEIKRFFKPEEIYTSKK